MPRCALPSDLGVLAMLKIPKMAFVFGNPNNLTDPYEVFIGTDPAKLAVSKNMVRA